MDIRTGTEIKTKTFVAVNSVSARSAMSDCPEKSLDKMNEEINKFLADKMFIDLRQSSTSELGFNKVCIVMTIIYKDV